MFTKGTKTSKPVAAQYLAELLIKNAEKEGNFCKELESKLPKYLVAAVKYVTSSITNGK